MDALDFLISVIYGIVEGITEWLPVSSTGHMILLKEFLPLNVSDEFWEMYLEIIQLGAVIAVFVIFRKRLWPFKLPAEGGGIEIKRKSLRLWQLMIVSCLPAVVFALIGLDSWFKERFYNYKGVAAALIIFGLAIIAVEIYRKGKPVRVEKVLEITMKDALIIGVFQLLAAMFPGTSRSAATIVGAMLIGISRPVAAEFTFLLSFPVMFGASLLEIIRCKGVTGGEVGLLLTGMVVAFVVSMAVIRFLTRFVRKNDLRVFGYYRIVLGLLVLLYFAIAG
ncbi:MAG: undecaprenyl-diphosphate phosphatase [Lachnospiraceae bacterium]|nr:undecaprenyl-diphosphate phosphatase [Lachnospiraceae bacterium]